MLTQGQREKGPTPNMKLPLFWTTNPLGPGFVGSYLLPLLESLIQTGSHLTNDDSWRDA